VSTKPLNLVVAINPSASFGKSRHVGPAIVTSLRALGHTVNSLTAPSFAELVLAGQRAVAEKPDALVVVGGDGMVSLGTNLVAKTKVPLGIIPSGTGNDMARGLGIPYNDTEAAVNVLAEALTRPPRVIDAALIRHTDDKTGLPKETWFACLLSAGFDAIANERANSMHHPKGPSRYTIALVIELAKLKPIKYRLVLDGVETIKKATLVSVGNGVSLGGGMLVTPDALLDDGLLDVLVVDQLSRTAFLRIFPRVFKGTHVTDSRVNIQRAKHIIIDAENVAAYADGERVGPLPIDIRVVPNALRVLAPLPVSS
jgi:diacylglycerol kinase (ATP)